MGVASPLGGLLAAPATRVVGPPANVATDEFERDVLGPTWTVALGSVGIVNRSDLGLTSGTIGIVSWAGSDLGPDQTSEATISGDRVDNMLTQVYARRRQSDAARYGFHYDGDQGDGTPGASAWQIKFDGVPTAQTRILASSTAPAPLPGDVLRLEVRGVAPVELRGFHNGALILTATHTGPSIIVDGPPGLAFRLRVGTATTYPSPVAKRWVGRRLLPTAPPPSATTTPPSATTTPTTRPLVPAPLVPRSRDLATGPNVAEPTTSTSRASTSDRLSITSDRLSGTEIAATYDGSRKEPARAPSGHREGWGGKSLLSTSLVSAVVLAVALAVTRRWRRAHPR